MEEIQTLRIYRGYKNAEDKNESRKKDLENEKKATRFVTCEILMNLNLSKLTVIYLMRAIIKGLKLLSGNSIKKDRPLHTQFEDIQNRYA